MASVETSLSAARGEARRRGFDPEKLSADDAQGILDNMCRSNRDLSVCIWYHNASDARITAFHRGWNRWKREQKIKYGGVSSKHVSRTGEIKIAKKQKKTSSH